MSQGDIAKVLVAMANRVMGKPTLAVNSGGAATIKTTVVPSGGMVFYINGQPLLKADLSAQVMTGLGLTNTGVGQFCLVRIELDASGTVGMVQGGMCASAAEATATIPTRSANKATIGTVLVPASFVWGTTALDAAGVVITDGDPDLGALAIAL